MITGPKRKPLPRGHVARTIAQGKRPFLTCTVAGDTFAAIDALATRLGLSRGRTVDLAIAAMLCSDLDASEASEAPEAPPMSERAA